MSLWTNQRLALLRLVRDAEVDFRESTKRKSGMIGLLKMVCALAFGFAIPLDYNGLLAAICFTVWVVADTYETNALMDRLFCGRES